MLFRPIVVPSLMIVLRSVSLGLPLFLLLSGTNFNACSGNLFLFILSTCPILLANIGLCPPFFPYHCRDILLFHIFPYLLVCFEFFPSGSLSGMLTPNQEPGSEVL